VANKKHVVSGPERERLSALISKDKAADKTVPKARILLKAHALEASEGLTDEDLRSTRHEHSMVMRVRAKLVEEGLMRCSPAVGRADLRQRRASPAHRPGLLQEAGRGPRALDPFASWRARW
jgi:hypothetical protein